MDIQEKREQLNYICYICAICVLVISLSSLHFMNHFLIGPNFWTVKFNKFTNIYNVNSYGLCHPFALTLSWWRSLSYTNQSFDLFCKSMDWFLYDKDLRHERFRTDANIIEQLMWNQKRLHQVSHLK